jgi:DNA-binding transcriptional MerR regulator
VRQYSTREVADIAGLAVPQIRRWARAGLVTPTKDSQGRWRYSFQDLALLRTASNLLAAKLTPHRVTRALRLIREQLPPGRPLSAVRIVVDGRRVLVKDRLASWEPESRQGTLDFDVKALTESAISSGRGAFDPPAVAGPRAVIHRSEGADVRGAAEHRAVTDLRAAAERRAARDRAARSKRGAGSPAAAERDEAKETAENLYAAGLDLELAGREREARKAYEAALARDPRHVSARINLGRLLHAAHSLPEAEALYRAALEHEPANALAAFNLGVALEDQDKIDAAIDTYRRALAIDESYADAHFNLARLLESRGDKRGALRHLSSFRRLLQRDS